MTSTIKVNNIQNQCGQNIINENSNTITKVRVTVIVAGIVIGPARTALSIV